jgi:predicted nucleic acid-binding protein
LSYLAETEFLFSLRPKDRWNKLSRKILQKAGQNRIRICLLDSAILEMRTVLYSLGKTPRDVYRSLVLINGKLIRYGITHEAMNIDDYILADKLREEFADLTYFDSIHAAAALRRNQTLITNDNVFARCEVKTISFRELAN